MIFNIFTHTQVHIIYISSKCPILAAFAAVAAYGIDLTFPLLDAALAVDNTFGFVSIVIIILIINYIIIIIYMYIYYIIIIKYINYYVNLHSKYPLHIHSNRHR